MRKAFHFRTFPLYQEALGYLDEVAALAEKLPRNSAALGAKLMDSATHLVVSVAGKSSGGSEIERSFMIDGALMSLCETAACLDIIRRRKLLGSAALENAEAAAAGLHESLQAMKKALKRR